MAPFGIPGVPQEQDMASSSGPSLIFRFVSSFMSYISPFCGLFPVPGLLPRGVHFRVPRAHRNRGMDHRTREG